MTSSCHPLAAYAAGLIATLVLAAWLTPGHWWRRPNLRALCLVAAGTWGIGALLLSLTQGAAVAAVTEPALNAQTYRVQEDLNLRAGKGTGASRVGVVPAGTMVTATGLRDGDWWQLSATVDGRELRGWSNSLWLRRPDEGRN